MGKNSFHQLSKKIPDRNKAIIIFLIILTLLCLFYISFPIQNGDIPFYIHSVISWEKAEEDAITQTLNILKEEFPEDYYLKHSGQLLSATGEYYDYYRIKPFYTLLIAGFINTGIDYFLATKMPSLLGFILVALLSFFWILKIIKPYYAVILTSVILISGPINEIARLSTPDALSAFFTLLALYLLIYNKGRKWFYLSLLICIGIRMDNIILAAILIILWEITNSKPVNYTGIIISLIVLSITGFLLNFFFTKDFFWLKNASFMRSPGGYLRQVLIYIKSVSESYLMAILLMLLILQYFFPMSIFQKHGRILAGMAIIIFIRFLLFPSFEDRFYVAFYITTIIIIIQEFTNRLNKKNYDPAPEINLNQT